MKKQKKLIIGIMIGLLIGCLLTTGCFMMFDQPSKEDKISDIKDKEEIVEDKKEENDTETEKEEISKIADTWNKEVAYVGGDKVIYKGLEYRAKWWTQNEEPSATSEVWECLGEVVVEEEMENEDVIVDKPAAGVKDFKVVAYYPSWKPQEIDKIDYSIVTHINYAFAIPIAEGGLRPLENEDVAKQIISKAHKRNVKVMLAVGGWSYNDTPLEATFMSATETDEKIKKFGDSIVDMCVKYGFDGIDMDWEHPRVDGTSKIQYEKLMVYLNQELHKKDKLLSAAVLSGATADGNIYYDAKAHTKKALDACDWINVMAYDGGDGERHSSYEFAVNSAKYWKETRKLPAYKVVLGVPFYARPSWAGYGELLKEDKDAYKKDVTTYNGMEVHYNGMKTIEKKSKYAKNHLGGVMIWEITQDTRVKDKRLIQAILNGIK